MSEKVLVFGKDTWPYTTEAREAFAKQGKEVEYLDVHGDGDALKSMLEYTKGAREVPTIVEQGKVTIGFNGGSWGV